MDILELRSHANRLHLNSHKVALSYFQAKLQQVYMVNSRHSAIDSTARSCPRALTVFIGIGKPNIPFCLQGHDERQKLLAQLHTTDERDKLLAKLHATPASSLPPSDWQLPREAGATQMHSSQSSISMTQDGKRNTAGAYLTQHVIPEYWELAADELPAGKRRFAHAALFTSGGLHTS